MPLKLFRFFLFACVASLAMTSQAAHAGKLTIAASEVPHAQILGFITPALAEQGVDLQIKIFSDYVQPNLRLADKELDANYFQHQPYLDAFNANRGTHLVSAGIVHIEPFGGYSKKAITLATLRRGAIVAIPNDPSNGGRALLLLQAQGLIKLKNSANILATPADIVENPHQLKFRELEAAMLPRALGDVDLALINTNYALEAGLVPTRDALFIEGADSPYANLVATRQDNLDSPDIRKLMAALRSPQVKEFIDKTYKGAVVAAF